MRSNRTTLALAGLIALALGAGGAQAQTATQVVTFKVVPANRMAFASATAAASPVRTAPTSARVTGSSYGITTNESNQKITASLNAPLPAGATVAVSLGAPAGAASRGTKTLGTRAADMVTGISAVTADALPVRYVVTGDVVGTPTVTYTITAGQ